MTGIFSYKQGWASLGIIIICLLLLDTPVATFLHTLQNPYLSSAFSFIGSFPLVIALFCAPLFWREGAEKAPWQTAWCAVIAAFCVTVVLKQILLADRPFVVFDWIPFESQTDHGFPSSHAAVVSALLPAVREYGSRLQKYGWWMVVAIILFARMYLQVHFISDIVAGMMVGLVIGQYGLTSAESLWKKIHMLSRWFDRETARQVLHIATGIMIVIFIRASLLTSELLLILTMVGCALALLHRRYRFPLVHTLLTRFDRERDMRTFPGKGALFLCVGCYLALILFEADIALASIMILALGDGFANIVGATFGSRSIFYNPSKHYEGTLAGVVAATIGAMFVVPAWIALAGSAVALFVESAPLRIKGWKIDDNVSIPLVAGLVMTGMTLFA